MTQKAVVFFDCIIQFGGAQKSTIRLCTALKRYYDVFVIDAYGCCQEYLKALSEADISFKTLLPGASRTQIGYKGQPLRRLMNTVGQLPELLTVRHNLGKVLSDIKPEVIWTNSSKGLFFLWTKASLSRTAVLLYARGWYKREQISSLGRWLIKRYADRVLAVSSPTAKELESWGVSPDKISVVYNTVDFEYILKQGGQDILKPVPCDNGNFKIVIPAALLRTKGQHTAIQAANILSREGFDFVMYLAGNESSGGDDSYVNYLRELIKKNGLGEKVFLLGWRSDVGALIGYSDVVVLPTHTEGFPRSVAESMLLKRPVISTPVGGVSDLITDGETGLLFEVNDEQGLASCLRRIMQDKELRNKLTSNAYHHISENFNAERHLKLIRDAFERSIERKKTR